MSDTPLKTLTAYTSGLVRQSTHLRGYGIMGYAWCKSPRNKNTSHPVKSAVRFTDAGFFPKSQGENIEVLEIYESAVSLGVGQSSNNTSDLNALLHCLGWVQKDPSFQALNVVTSSANVGTSFAQTLKKHKHAQFLNKAGKPIDNAHLWGQIHHAVEELKARGVAVSVTHTKQEKLGFGEATAELYARVGLNAARLESVTDTKPLGFVFDTITPSLEYKKEFSKKNILYFFKNVHFTSQTVEDSDRCFVSTCKEEVNTGHRNSESTFCLVKGEIPELIKSVKRFYRSIDRGYSCTCTAKLAGFEDRSLLRLYHKADIRFFLQPVEHVHNSFRLLGTEPIFLKENTITYPFIAAISKLSTRMHRLVEPFEGGRFSYDVMDIFTKEGKLSLTSKDNYVDLAPLTNADIVFTQKPILRVGYDCPTYLALKGLEKEMMSMEAIFQRDTETNFYTLFTKIKTPVQTVYCMNMPDKYLACGIVTQ